MSRPVSWSPAALFLLFSGCHRPSCPADAPDASSVRNEASAAAVALTPSPSRSDEEDAAVQDVRPILLAWNDALDHHDPAALEQVYAERVRYYGQELPKSAVLQSKSAAFRVQSTFHQQIVGEVAVMPRDDGARVATFLKRSGPAGKTQEIRAKIVLARRGEAGELRIVEETDDVTESANAARRRADCEAAASRAVNDLPEVKRAVAEAMRGADESDGRARFGGVGPIDDDDLGSFTVGIGIHTDERYEAEVWYSVDRTGHLSVTSLGSEVAVSEKALRAVEAACKR
jgi:hypothetical protein